MRHNLNRTTSIARCPLPIGLVVHCSSPSALGPPFFVSVGSPIPLVWAQRGCCCIACTAVPRLPFSGLYATAVHMWSHGTYPTQKNAV